MRGLTLTAEKTARPSRRRISGGDTRHADRLAVKVSNKKKKLGLGLGCGV